ncbi:MAG TPA: YARHG domain-containing protein [Hyphomicrobiaceae bacterium]|nr:YARHG domain-containing protein [Hyphomicrobiaceae bacterium]
MGWRFMISRRAIAISLFVIALMSGSMPARAQDYAAMSCGQLWYERNSIYAEYGYCFQTEQAIRAFGPACFPPFGRLPPHARRVVNEISAWERSRGCRAR